MNFTVCYRKVLRYVFMPFFVAITVVLMTALPLKLYAAQSGTPPDWSFPAPITDMVNVVRKIHIDIGNIELFDNISRKGRELLRGGHGDVRNQIYGTWQSANSWMSHHIGVSLSEIIRAFINLLIWVLNLIVRFLKMAIGYVW